MCHLQTPRPLECPSKPSTGGSQLSDMEAIPLGLCRLLMLDCLPPNMDLPIQV